MTIESFQATDANSSKHNLIDWMPNHPDTILWDTYFEELKGVTILPKDEAVVLRLTLADADAQAFSEFRDKVRNSLAQLTVSVSYRDVYKRLMPISSRSLN